MAASTLRLLKAGRRNLTGRGRASAPVASDLTIPTHFRCPISLDLMKDPVTLSTGITYDRQSIETWLDSGNVTCPVTNQVLQSFDQIPNHTIRRMIQDWCVQNRSFGIERIPTPRIPVSSAAVSGMLFDVSTGDSHRVVESVKKMNRLCRESERDRRCIVTGGAAAVLSAAFDSFAAENSIQTANGMIILEEILQVLAWMFPLDSESRSYLCSASSLRALHWFLKCGDLTVRRNAVLLMRELVTGDKRHLDTLMTQLQGFPEAFTGIIREPICPATSKASLVIVYHMVTSNSLANQNVVSAFVEMGLVPLLLEMIVDSDKSITEKALGVLDGICGSEEGRRAAYGHALAIPLLVKKMFRVSDLATEFIISLLWKLGKNDGKGDGGVLIEALQAGAFQKVLLLLQVGCCEKTKERATELLKMLNMHRERSECVDSMDFKQLKRPF